MSGAVPGRLHAHSHHWSKSPFRQSAQYPILGYFAKPLDVSLVLGANRDVFNTAKNPKISGFLAFSLFAQGVTLSAKMTFMVWDDRKNLTKHTELAVMLALADFADDEGFCWPAIATIARKARMAESTARSHIRTLQGRGLIRVEYNAARRGSNTYRLYPAGVNAAVTPPASGASTPPASGASPPASGATPTESRCPTPPRAGAEPTTKPKKEPNTRDAASAKEAEPDARVGEYDEAFRARQASTAHRSPAMPKETAAYLADCLNGSGYYPTQTVRKTEANELLHRKLITSKRLKERNIDHDPV